MKYRSILILLIAGLLSSVAIADDKRPNVLFISIDDLNDWLGCYGGHPQVKTPHIDRLAGEGVLFSNAHCQAPICNPSRVSLILGQLPSTTGMYFLAPNFRTVEKTQDAETLFQYFRRHDYYLSTMGKIFHGTVDKPSFDHIEPASGWRRPAKKIHYTIPGSHPGWDWGEVDAPDEEMRDYKTAEWAAKELPKLAKRSEPFFLAVGFSLPHVPIYASKKWFDLYPLDEVQLPDAIANDREDLPDISKTLTLNPTGPRHEWMIENDEARHAVRAYLATNSFVDHLVGMVLEGLEASGEADNTIIVLWSDHGFHLGEKQRWAKRTLWEDTTRVPLIITAPGMAEGEVCSRPVGLIDLYPTLTDMCGLPPKADNEGVSLKRLLLNPQAAWEQPTLTTFGPNNHSIRSEHWRYTRYVDGTEELYDHRKDPNEWTNLASNPEYVQVMRRHRTSIPKLNAVPLPGSAGSDSPLYGEGGGVSLSEAMKRAASKQ